MSHYSEHGFDHMSSTSMQASPNIRAARKGKDIPALLFDLLRRATPYGTEHHIISLFPFKDKGTVDAFGNFHVRVGDNPTIMFSSHMDTVHTIQGANEKKEYGIITPLMMNDKALETQQGFVWAGVPRYKVAEGKRPELLGYGSIALGADDKVGVYTMCKMIEAQIPGLYVFHVGEEVGCQGSKRIVTDTPEIVKGIQACIAFDRAGYTDVIAHQRGTRCASDVFSNALAKGLNELIGARHAMYQFSGGARGVYTDSAEYLDIVPECTNISVGYFSQHGGMEKFDLYWYEKYFLPAVLKLDWANLPISRDPVAEKKSRTNYYSNTSYASTWKRDRAAFVKISEVDKNTPLNKIPDWKPEDGFLEEASVEGMSRMIYNWMFGPGKQQQAADLIAQLLLEVQIQQEENDDLQDKLDNAEDGHDPVQDLVEEPATDAGHATLDDDPNAGSSVERVQNAGQEIVEGKEGVATAGDKMALLTSFFQLIGQVPFTAKEKNRLTNIRAQYDKLCRRTLRTKKISKEDFATLNGMLYRVSGEFLQHRDNIKSGILDNLMRDALRHMWDNCNEPGLEEVKEEHDDAATKLQAG